MNKLKSTNIDTITALISNSTPPNPAPQILQLRKDCSPVMHVNAELLSEQPLGAIVKEVKAKFLRILKGERALTSSQHLI